MHKAILLSLLVLLLFAGSAQAQFNLGPDCDGDFRSDLIVLQNEEAEDCDRDGRPDICSLQPSGYGFAGTVRNEALPAVNGIVSGGQLADLNGDGRIDVIGVYPGATTSALRRLKIFLADVDGTFSEAGDYELNSGTSSAIRTLQGALGLDIIYGSLFFANDGNASFTKFSLSELEGSIVGQGDFSGDGRDDLLLSRQVGTGEEARYSLESYLNQGSGSFALVEVLLEDSSALNVRLHDLNNDNRFDVAVARQSSDQSTELLFYTAAAGGAFDEPLSRMVDVVVDAPLQFGDIDGDSSLDLLLRSGRSLYRALNFNLNTTPLPLELAGNTQCLADLVDIDGDGDLDFSCKNGYRPTTCCTDNFQQYFLNDGAGYFYFTGQEFRYTNGRLTPTGISDEQFVDLNSDGKPDRVSLFLAGTIQQQNLLVQYTNQGTFTITLPTGTDQNRDFQPDVCGDEGLFVRRYSLWNSYAQLTNILELVNVQDSPVQLRVQLRDLVGEVVNSIDLELAAGQQRDLILNEFSALAAPSYGIVEVLSTKKLAGAVSYYRQTPPASRAAAGFDTGEYDFAFQIPLTVPKYTAESFLFNSFQPSAFGADRLPVFNWLTVVNLSPETSQYSVTTKFDRNPEALQRSAELGEFGRVDLDGGHGFGDGFTRGFHTVTPVSEGKPYLALLTRYGTTFDPNRYSYAFAATGAEQSTIVSTGGNAVTWLEIANAEDGALTLSAAVRNTLGEEIFRGELTIEPSANAHYLINDWIGNNATGTLSISRLSGVGSYHSQVVSYFYSPTRGAIETAYLLPETTRSTDRLFASYNLYLGMFNWLRIANRFSSTYNFTASVLPPDGSGPVLSQVSAPLAQGAVLELDLHNTVRFNTAVDSYGLVKVELDSNNSVALDVLRVKPTVSGGFDFIMPTSLK